MITLAIGFLVGVLWRRYYIDRILAMSGHKTHRPRLLAAGPARCRCEQGIDTQVECACGQCIRLVNETPYAGPLARLLPGPADRRRE